MHTLTISYLKASRPDIKVHLERLKPAFRGSANPKAEWQDMAEKVRAGHASLYLIKAQGVLIRLVGQVIDGMYHIICAEGCGLIHAAPLIIEKCLVMHYPAITYHSYRRGMGRILRRFGFELDKVLTASESRYVLRLGGLHG